MALPTITGPRYPGRAGAGNGAAPPGAAMSQGRGDAVPAAAHVGPVDVRDERVDVLGPRRGEVADVGVLVDVERQDRGGVPHREGVLAVADVDVEPVPVPVVREPGPAAARHAARAELGEERVEP